MSFSKVPFSGSSFLGAPFRLHWINRRVFHQVHLSDNCLPPMNSTLMQMRRRRDTWAVGPVALPQAARPRRRKACPGRRRDVPPLRPRERSQPVRLLIAIPTLLKRASKIMNKGRSHSRGPSCGRCPEIGRSVRSNSRTGSRVAGGVVTSCDSKSSATSSKQPGPKYHRTRNAQRPSPPTRRTDWSLERVLRTLPPLRRVGSVPERWRASPRQPS